MHASRRKNRNDICLFECPTVTFLTFAPLFQRSAKFRNRVIRVGIFRRKFLPFAQEVTTMLHYVVKRQINKTDISLLIGFHQPFTQMIDSWKLVIVIDLGKIASVK